MPVFLPAAIDQWGGIVPFLSGDRSRMKPYGRRYTIGYGESRPGLIMQWLKLRLARDGRRRVAHVNAILWMAAKKYSGAPERTYEAVRLSGYGRVVLRHGFRVCSSVDVFDVMRQVERAIDETQRDFRPFTVRATRLTWPACVWSEAARSTRFGVQWTALSACDFCGAQKQAGHFGVYSYAVSWDFARAIGLSLPIAREDIDERRAAATQPMSDEECIASLTRTPRRSPRLCVACRNRMRPLDKAWRAAELARRTINRTKRTIHEAAQDHA